jgi:hypothetical protein
MEWDWGQMIAPLVTAIIGAATIFILGTQYYFSRKRHQVQGLLEAFKILDKEDHREYRKTVFSTYFIYHNFGNVEVFRHEDYRDAIANVMADFDVVGKLVDSKNIDRNQFLEMYGALVYRCWKCLKPHVEKERLERKFPPFMTWFEWLANEGYYYWKDEREDKRCNLDDTVLFHPDDRSRYIYFRDIPREKEKEKEKKASPI